MINGFKLWQVGNTGESLWPYVGARLTQYKPSMRSNLLRKMDPASGEARGILGKTHSKEHPDCNASVGTSSRISLMAPDYL